MCLVTVPLVKARAGASQGREDERMQGFSDTCVWKIPSSCKLASLLYWASRYAHHHTTIRHSTTRLNIRPSIQLRGVSFMCNIRRVRQRGRSTVGGQGLKSKLVISSSSSCSKKGKISSELRGGKIGWWWKALRPRKNEQ